MFFSINNTFRGDKNKISVRETKQINSNQKILIDESTSFGFHLNQTKTPDQFLNQAFSSIHQKQTT